jgi:tetratricopeptide (TPR) repeat protein
MKKAFSIVAPVLFAFGLFLIKQTSADTTLPGSTAGMEPDITLCATAAGTVMPGPDGKFIPALPGVGNLSYAVTTAKDSAQVYFNQGLSFYYGYHFTEALASFKEASRFDPACGMAYWGQALAMGPFYNTYVYKMRQEIPETIAMMEKNSSNATAKEKDLMQAMQRRYSNDFTNADRQQLNRSYAEALAALTKKYPQDDNIQALYVDAVMLEHKWDFWDHEGKPKPWTPELLGICESALKNAQHPAMLHYYIHLTEASRRADRALFAADLLKDGLPGIGHMVHMATHMYQRNGLYERGVTVNEEANAVNNNVDTRAPVLKLGKDKSIHYFAVQSYCALSAGMYAKGVPIYERARRRQLDMAPVFEKDTYAQFVHMIPVMARVRLGKWNEVLQAPAPAAQWSYAVVLDNFAKGMAHIRSKDLRQARQCLDRLSKAMADSILMVRLMPFNSPIQSCKTAEGILKGELLYAEGNSTAALEAFQQAIDAEDHLVYREPQDWLIPARQYLGYCLLRMNKPAEAEKIYQQDLELNPGNGWSLLGMHQALNAQKKPREAALYKEKYTQAFKASDVKPQASVF